MRPFRGSEPVSGLCPGCRGSVSPLDRESPALGIFDAEDSVLAEAQRLIA